MPPLRQTAYKCRISHLINGRYVQKAGWEPSYVETNLGNISRANLIGIVVSKEERSLILDDGSGQIRLMSFEENNPLLHANVGDQVLVIGRPRAFNDQIYLNVEILKKINEKWLRYRKLELQQLPEAQKITTPPTPPNPLLPEVTLNQGEHILEQIKQLDTGEGADVDEVIKAVKLDHTEKMIQNMLQEGEIYEIRPGRLKLL